MAIETATNGNNSISWPLLLRALRGGKAIPLIGNMVSMEHMFGQLDIGEAWAAAVKFPFRDREPERIAQYLSVLSGYEVEAKDQYLDFLKTLLFRQAQTEQPNGTPNPFLDTLKDELPRLTVSKSAERLGFAVFKNEPDNPFSILAKLPFPIYLTTSYHTLLEDALRAVGKTPRQGIYSWSDDLEGYAQQLPFDPMQSREELLEQRIQNPLVFHLHGIDSDSASLVLAEDNFFEFFEHISHDLERAQGLPPEVQQAMALSSLIMIGYDVHSWPFRVVFRGPVRAILNQKQPPGLSIQMKPQPEAGIEDVEAVKRYFDVYFSNNRFNIYWGDVQSFTRELWTQWEQ
ncbi:MAG: SIR2 family protein [Anaerolineae bacterium]|nr:SIR2 family protein [Anaerolineae bacterium]MCO5195569.1 SIR2 family protein [Anaerolineae bacterium]MCO5203514.1 SIR2 family protein [Anaerolineae bacterium]